MRQQVKIGLLDEHKGTIADLSSYHEEISKAYERLTSSGFYGDYFIDSFPTPRNILELIYRRGGGVTESEILSSSGERAGEMLELLTRGLSPNVLEMRVTDYRGMIDPYYSALALKLFSRYAHTTLPHNILKPALHKEPNGTYYVTCQKREDKYVIDMLAKLGDVKSSIQRAEDILSSSADLSILKNDLKLKEKAVLSAKEERRSLGLFKGFRGKELKQQIKQLELEISEMKNQIGKVSKAQEELNEIESSLKALG